jgi:hypothetical protein
MLDALASRLALDHLRRTGSLATATPAGPARHARPRRGSRLARRVARRLARRRPRAGRLPATAFDLEAPHKLTTSELWSVWTVAHLESELSWRAWRLAAAEHRMRAHRAYRAALEREAGAARLLAERTAEPAAAVGRRRVTSSM